MEKTNRRPALTMKKRILLILVVFTLAVALVLIVGWYQSSTVTERMDEEIGGYYAINAFANQFLTAQKALDLYWRSPQPGSDQLLTFQESTQAAYRQLAHLDRRLAVIGTRQYLWANALESMYDSWVREATAVINLMNTDPDAALQHYYSGAVTTSVYVQQYAQKLLECKLADGQDFYRQMQLAEEHLRTLQIMTLLLAMGMGVVLLRSLIRLLTPMQKLADASRAITEQDFTQPDLDVERDDEVGRMAHAFNQMKHSMQRSVETLREKNEMAARLHKKEMETLEMESLLGEAKLAQLRSQINPHFLFNTLNVISRMAHIEKAPRTKTLVLALAHLLRYSLESDAEQVPLAREAHIIDEFFAIYKTRFGDRVNLRWQIHPDDMELNDVMVPSFILQPLVENAFKHGISPKIDGGVVEIRVKRKGPWLYISVSDNGVGMPPDRLAVVRQQIRDSHPRPGHIGLYNVAERIRLTGRHCLIRACSRVGVGTSIVMRVPYREITEEMEEQDAENTDRG